MKSEMILSFLFGFLSLMGFLALLFDKDLGKERYSFEFGHNIKESSPGSVFLCTIIFFLLFLFFSFNNTLESREENNEIELREFPNPPPSS
jgi:hypothetical protein